MGLPSHGENGAGVTGLANHDLIQLARQKDDAAFVELMRRTRTASLRLAWSILRVPEAAEDEVQTAYFNAWRHMANFQADASFSTWISRIVVNQCLMRLREWRRLKLVAIDESRPDWYGRQPVSRELNAEEHLRGAQLSASLREHILRLPPLLRHVLVLRDVDEIPTAEVAHQLNISAAAVKSRLLRARLELRRRLDERVEKPGLAVAPR